MKCPSCDIELSVSTREGVEIDHCPRCRGVWLDRGELDKILGQVAAPQRLYRDRDHDDDDDDDYRENYRREPKSYRDDDYRPRKRESLWSKLFDFD